MAVQHLEQSCRAVAVHYHPEPRVGALAGAAAWCWWRARTVIGDQCVGRGRGHREGGRVTTMYPFQIMCSKVRRSHAISIMPCNAPFQTPCCKKFMQRPIHGCQLRTATGTRHGCPLFVDGGNHNKHFNGGTFRLCTYLKANRD